MDITENILTDKRYKKQIALLSTKILKIIAEDHVRALVEAHKGIKQEEPERVNDLEYLEAMADGMQELAQAVLKNRTTK